MGLAWTYFTSPDYLVVQCWVCPAFLYPDTIKQAEPQVYRYTNFLSMWWVTCFWVSPCTRLMAVISFTNSVFPYVLTADPALELANFPV